MADGNSTKASSERKKRKKRNAQDELNAPPSDVARKVVQAEAHADWPKAGGLPLTGRLVYLLFFFLARLSLPLFFSDIIVIGRKKNIPQRAPVIFVANHNNDLIDGLLIGTTVGRYVGFWAKAPLFKGPLGWALAACGGVPVVRRQERATNGMVENDAAASTARAAIEAQTFDAFNKGRAMMVFPEGTSHAGTKLLQLKDGVSWTAFKFADHCDNKTPLLIVPIGLMYLSADRWRSEVVIKFGDPVQVTDENLREFRSEPKTAVKHFTAQLEHLLHDVTLNFDDKESMHAAHAARRIFLDYRTLTLAQSVEFARRLSLFSDMMKDDPDVQNIRKDILDYEGRRHNLALRDIDVQRGLHVDFASALRSILTRLLMLIVLTVLTLSGLLLNGPAIILARSIHRKIPDQESKATGMLLAGLLVVPLVYISAALILSWFSFIDFSFWQVLALECFFGLLHVRFLEEERNLARSFRASYRVMRVVMANESRHELDKLRDLRADLQKRMTSTLERAIKEHEELRGFDSLEGTDAGERLDLGPISRLNRHFYGPDSSRRKDSSKGLLLDRELPLTDSRYDRYVTQGHT